MRAGRASLRPRQLSGAGLWLGGHLPQLESQRGLRPERSSGFSPRSDEPPPACVGRGQGDGKRRCPHPVAEAGECGCRSGPGAEGVAGTDGGRRAGCSGPAKAEGLLWPGPEAGGTWGKR